MTAVIENTGFTSGDEQAYTELMRYGLITDGERMTSMQSPSPHGFPDLACALMWMRQNGALAEQRWHDLRAQVQQERSLDGATERAHIVEQAHEGWEQFMAQRTGAAEVSERKTPSGRLLAVAASCVFFAGAYFLYQLSVVAPACNAGGTIGLVNNILHEAMPDVGDGKRAAFTLAQVKEIGYVPAHRLRGCTATVMIGKEVIPYAFVVGPRADSYGKLGVIAADRSIVEARYGHIGTSGDFANLAEPIGRESLVAALRQEAQARRLFQSILASDTSSPLAILNTIHAHDTREISDVEPLGACRELKAGTRYACDLLIEHNDLSFAAFGVRAQILQGEFTFVRKANSNEWSVSNDFGTEFELAKRNAKPATFSGNRKS